MRALALCLVVLLAGCLETLPAGQEDEAPAPPPFESAGAPLVAFHAQNQCGMCASWGTFWNPEWELFAVFENGRAILVHYNPGDGDGDVHVAPGIAYDEEELARLLAPAVRHAFGNEQPRAAWVAQVETGIVSGASRVALSSAVNESWRPLDPEISLADCMDCAGDGLYGRPDAQGDIDIIAPNRAPPPDTPRQQDFRAVMDAMDAARASFVPSTSAEAPAQARVVLVEERLEVETEGDAQARGSGHCLDARLLGNRLALPLPPQTPLPSLVVMRALDDASLQEPHVDPARRDPRTHALGFSYEPTAQLRSALDPSRVLLNVTLSPEGVVLVEGEPLEGERVVRREHTLVQEGDEDPETGRAQVHAFHVVETLTVRDAGNLTLAPERTGAICSG